MDSVCVQERVIVITLSCTLIIDKSWPQLCRDYVGILDLT